MKIWVCFTNEAVAKGGAVLGVACHSIFEAEECEGICLSIFDLNSGEI